MASALDLPNATEPERLVMSRGNLFSVTTTAGNIVPPGARELGLFYQDTRHLSFYELGLPLPTLRLSGSSVSAVLTQIDLTASTTEPGGLVEEPVHFLHVRRKQILDESLVDQLIFTNYLGRAIELSFDLRFAADFADIFEVRGARRPARGDVLVPVLSSSEGTEGRADRIVLRYRGTEGELYHTMLRFTPAPETINEEVARFRLNLEPGEAQLQEIVVTPGRGEKEERIPRIPFDVRVSRNASEAEELRRRSTRIGCDNRVILGALERALTDVHALRILHDGQWIVGAGIPWFAAPFGRDSLITSTEMLAFAPGLAAETLRFLARYQGVRDDPLREEEPGKIMHELRRGEMTRAGEVPHSPYYGTVDATPLYVVLAGEFWRWTADRALLDAVWPAVRAAMSWVDRRTDRGTQFLTYQRTTPRGLDNQGWKDSKNAVSFPDGGRALPPIALVEVQGYVLDAYRHGARLAQVRGEHDLAAEWASRVEPMRRRIDEAFWNRETAFYAMALDRSGRQVPTLSSNPGHLLWSRAVDARRAERVTEVLLGPEMYSGWGIRTLGRGQTVYNPISYHNGTVWPHDNAIAAMGMARYGLHDESMKILVGLFAAAEHFAGQRLPELFCGMARGERELIVQYPVSCSPQAWASGALFMMLQASLGLDPNAEAGRFRIWNPRLPRSIRRLDLLSMRVGQALVSLRFMRAGRRTHADVLDVRGGPLRVEIEID